MSRDKILKSIKAAKPDFEELPAVEFPVDEVNDKLQKFLTVANSVGTQTYLVDAETEISDLLSGLFPAIKKITTTVNLKIAQIQDWLNTDAHDLANVDLHILTAQYGVAENGAVWISENDMGKRVAPTITEHLAVIIKAENIVATMHQAYESLETADYGYGLFLGGPSKTADIEQMLVLGAHGARSMHVFILK